MANISIDINFINKNEDLKKGKSLVIKRNGITVTITNKDHHLNRKYFINNLFNIEK